MYMYIYVYVYCYIVVYYISTRIGCWGSNFGNGNPWSVTLYHPANPEPMEDFCKKLNNVELTRWTTPRWWHKIRWSKKNIQLASWSSICVYIYYIRVHSYSFIFLVLNHSESTFYRYQWIPFVFPPFFRFNHQPQTLHPNRAFCGRWGLFSPPTPRGRLHASALGNIIDIIMDLLHQ